VSVLYCTIPHFAATLARRDAPELGAQPLVLLDPEGQVFGVSAEADACGITIGLTARAAEIRCPAARLLDADVARCRAEREILIQLLERYGKGVEPHGWGAAYTDLDNLARDSTQAVGLLREIGRTVRGELGEALQPALGWDQSKFTAQAAARYTQPGRLRAVEGTQERAFLHPLSVALLPLDGEMLQRLQFLGLYTLGQYSVLPPAAVWQQFGRAGRLAHRCARGEDDRPVVPRLHAQHLQAAQEFDFPLIEREQVTATIRRLVSPLVAELRGSLLACGQIRLEIQFDNNTTQERTRTFLQPVSKEALAVQALEELLDGMRWTCGAQVLVVTLGQIQEASVEQRTLFVLENEQSGKLKEVERYLETRFGTLRLRRAALTRPGAPLPEWRIGWVS
jgi:nucleotidyltransferase/DNA polymerase involved in DNA repair